MAARTPICTNAVGRANVVPVSLDEHLFDCANWGILRTTPTQTPRGDELLSQAYADCQPLSCDSSLSHTDERYGRRKNHTILSRATRGERH
jgi:hypothetical protein